MSRTALATGCLLLAAMSSAAVAQTASPAPQNGSAGKTPEAPSFTSSPTTTTPVAPGAGKVKSVETPQAKNRSTKTGGPVGGGPN